MTNTNYSVKKRKSVGIIVLALLLSAHVSAKVDSYLGAYGYAGQWSLIPTQSESPGSMGIGGGLGFMYELQAGPAYSQTQFLFNVGAGALGGWTRFTQAKTLTLTLENQRDLQGDLFDYVYEIKNRHDKYSNIGVQVPLMVGVQHKYFYLLVGAKVDASLWAQAATDANVITYGKYAEFGDTRKTPMPEYQFFDGRMISSEPQKTKLNLNVDLSLEVGGRLGIVNEAVGYDVPNRNIEYRLAAFVDYGLFDMHVSGTREALTTPMVYDTDENSANYVYEGTSMVDRIQTNDIMATHNFAKAVNNLMVGVKFTVLFQLPKAGKCVTCSYNASRRRSSGARRRMKYEE